MDFFKLKNSKIINNGVFRRSHSSHVVSTTWLWGPDLSTTLVKTAPWVNNQHLPLERTTTESTMTIKFPFRNDENALIKTDSAYNIDLEADEAKVDSVAKMLRQLDISRAAYIEKASHIPGTCIKSSLADEAILDSSECVRRFAEDPSV